MPRALIFVALVVLLTRPASAAPQDGEPWRDMDYGPFLSAAIEVTPDNIACKGIAIPLDADGHRAMLFDTAELRWVAGWTGDFVELRGIVYDGPHGIWPRIAGEPAWTNPVGPGIAYGAARFDDPRAVPYGPLPAELGRFRGLVRDDLGVVLGYSIADAELLETAAIESHASIRAWTREIETSGASRPVHLSVAGFDEPVTATPHGSFIAVRAGARVVAAAALVGDRRASDFALNVVGDRVVLTIAPGDATRFKLLFAPLTGATTDTFAALVAGTLPPSNLRERWNSGSPARWPERLELAGERDVRFDDDDFAEPIVRNAGDPARARMIRVNDDERPSLVTLGGETVDEPGASTRDALLVLAADRGDAPEPIAGWNCDEGEGAFMHSVVDGAADLRLDGVTWRRGVVGRSLDFDGTARATWTGGDDLDLTRTSLTVSAWVHTTGDGTIFSQTKPQGPWVPDGKTLFIRDGHLCYDVGWVGVVCGKAIVADGRWHHVAMTWNADSSEVALWIDGAEDARAELAPRQAVAGHVVRFGFTAENFPGTTWFSGFMDGIRLHDRVLDGTEIRAVAAESGEPLVRALAVRGGVEGRWQLDDRRVELAFPAATDHERGDLVRWRGPRSRVDAVAAMVAGNPSESRRPFEIDRLEWPADNPWRSWMRFGDFDFLADGRAAAITTWSGDVWRVDGLDADLDRLSWQRIASGLSQPLGLATRGDEILVVGRDQITRLVDLDGDRETDRYEAFNVDAMNSPHFHEPASGLQVGPDGSLYYLKAARHAKVAIHPQHGTLIRVSADGRRSEIVAGGFRAPNGVWIDDDGIAWGSDQEGHWMPANRINRIVPGGFYGNNWSADRLGIETPRATHDPPLCWIHPEVDRSPAAQVRVPADTWGELGGALLGISYGTGEVYLIVEDEIDGIHQGGVVPLPIETPTGIMRGRFGPHDGALYVCGLFGWSSDQTEPGGFYRVRRTQSPLTVPRDVRAVRDGLVLRFTHPVVAASADPDAFALRAWNYDWSSRYGSPRFRLGDGGEGITDLAVDDVEVSPDGHTVWLRVPEMTTAMQMHLEWDLEFANVGRRESYVHLTVHRLAGSSGSAIVAP